MLDSSFEEKWDTFVLNHKHSTFFHQIGWKRVVEKTYGHKPLYLFAEENGEITGILPLFLVDSLIFGKRLISVPYGPYAGGCARSYDIVNTLVSKAIELAKGSNVKFLELRNVESIPDMPTNDKNVTMILKLGQGEKAIWAALGRGTKACIKKAAKANLNVSMDSKNIKGFYSLYCRRMHELGTPVSPISFFRNILEQFPDTSIATTEYKGEVIASQVFLFFKKTIIYGWGASSKRHSELHPVHLLEWEALQSSIGKGFEVFDFGRSAQDSGTYEFKRRWGAEPQTLYYQYYLNRIRDIPYLHPSNPKYSLPIRAWCLLPLELANRIGPIVTKYFI